jgi:predicted ATPase
MTKLKIKNIGPVKDGFDAKNGFMDFKGVTLFIGNQGSGKSTVAKIFSTLSWIEKALVRGDFTDNYLSRYNRFKKQFAYQGISNYFNKDSSLEYIGNAYTIKYHQSQLILKRNDGKSEYKFPKIMYVPAERNFVSSVERPDLIKRLPLPLYTFLDEYEDAKQNLTEGIKLPVGDISFEYKKQNKKSWITGDDFKIELLEASSGYQSVVPLFIVTNYLTQEINRNDSLTRKEISVDEEKRIRIEIDEIIKSNISSDIRKVLLEKLSARFRYTCFLNIVEEPEQNLYPTSQKNILFELLRLKNNIKNNKLIITTHSPYIINYLTLAIKAYNVKKKILKNPYRQNLIDSLIDSLSKVVPVESVQNPASIVIYQLGDGGSISLLDSYKGLPSDENFLNGFLEESNDSFIELLELEDKCQ